MVPPSDIADALPATQTVEAVQAKSSKRADFEVLDRA
jgi:hypothetical protein